MKTYKDLNTTTYNLVAKSYQGEHTEELEWASELKKFVHLVGKKDAKVLDLGAGPGTEAIWLATHFNEGRVFAVDLAEEMLKLFSSTLPNLEALQDDMVTYTPPEKVDGIWARASVHHLNKEEMFRLFSNAQKYLKESGVFLMINKYGSDEEIEEKQKYGQVVKRYFQYLNEDTVEDLAKKTGFEVKEQYVVENDHKWLVSILGT